MSSSSSLSSLSSSLKSPEEQITGDIDIATTSASRSIYLAGFTYLRIRLYAITPSSDVRFVSFIAGSFCLSVLSAVLSLIFKFFIDRCHTIKQKQLFDNYNRNFYVKGAYICFLLALILFYGGLSRIGWVYFNELNSKYIPFGLFLFGGSSIIFTTIYIITTKRKVDSNEINLAKIPKRNGESLDIFLSKQMDILIERAIFIGGIAINGVTFYVETTESQNLARVYLFFMSLAAISSLYVSGVLSTLRIFMSDIPSSSKTIYAYNVLSLGQICFVIYLASFLFLAIALTFIGYGVQYSRDKFFTIDVGIIGVSCMFIGLIYTIYCHSISKNESTTTSSSSTTTTTSSSSIEESIKSTLTTSKLIGSICNITSGFVFFNLLFYNGVITKEVGDTQVQSQIYLLSNAVALMLCITVSVFDSILQLFTNDLETYTQRNLFLNNMYPVRFISQLGTFLAIGCVFVSYGLGAIVKFTPNSYIPAFCSGICGFMILLGISFFAYMKYYLPFFLNKLNTPNQSNNNNNNDNINNPLQQSNDHENNNGKLTSSSSSSSSKNPIPQYKAERYSKRPIVLSALAGCIMFFGGFAYTSIINLSYDDKVIEKQFVTFMSFIFIFSYSIITWSIFYLLFFSSFPTPKEKILFVILTSPVYKLALFLSGLTLISTIVGFCMMGYTKTNIEHYHLFSLIMIIAAIFASLLVIAILWRVYLDYRVVTDDTKLLHNSERISTLSNSSSTSNISTNLSISPSSTNNNNINNNNSNNNKDENNSIPTPDISKILINQLSATVSSASFIAGNILYELLFINPLYRYSYALTVSYITLSATTFISAVSAVVIINITLFLLGTLTSKESNQFALKLYENGIQLYVFSFTLSALLTWMTGASLLPHVVFLQTINNRWPLSIFCSITSIFIIYTIYDGYQFTKKITSPSFSEDTVVRRETEVIRETESKVISGL